MSIDLEDKRNYIVSSISSILFSCGLWIIIDVAATYTEINRAMYTIVAFAILGFMLIISVSNKLMSDDTSDSVVCSGAMFAKIVTFSGFVMSFSTIVAALWVLFGNFVGSGVNPWPGIAFVLQTLLMLAAALCLRFGRKTDEY